MNPTRENPRDVQRGKRFRKFFIPASVVILLAIVAIGMVIYPGLAARAQSSDWPELFGSNARTGFNAGETIINPGSAPNLKLHWSQKAGGSVSTQPIETNGMLYWGSWDGIEHASDPSTGNPIWTANLGQTTDCRGHALGVLSSATVASVVIGGAAKTVVFVGGGNNNLYALNANNGNILWQTPLGSPPNSFIYSSPAYFNGSVYIGVSGNGDCSKVQGQLVQVDASTGTVLHTFTDVPSNCMGGSIWTSPTINETTGMLYISTGERGKCSTHEKMVESLIELQASDLSLVGYWQVPPAETILDGDFGASPMLFSATVSGVSHQLVGLENKNGIYYVFDQSNISGGPLWQVRLSTPPGPSISSSAWDGSVIYVAAGAATINGVSCTGTLYALNPGDGSTIWSDCLNFDVWGGVMAVPGLVEVGTGTSFIVVDAQSGNVLFSFHDKHQHSNFEGPGTISNGVLYHGNLDGSLFAFGL